MANPCVADTASIALTADGSPAVLEATIINPSATFSATFGDDTKRDVTDTGVQHDDPAGGWPVSIDNSAGTLTLNGIVVIALNPTWVAATDPISLVSFARLTINGVVSDERDMQATGIDMLAGASQLVALGSLVGQLSVPPGATHSIAISHWIKNIGASGVWSFRFGGSKLVATESF